MLYLRTGLPGASKTLNTLKEICEDTSLIGRPRFYNNIKLLFLDYDVCQSFSGYFYGVYLPSVDNVERQKLNKIIIRVHSENELISLDDVPHVRVHYQPWLESGGAFRLWVDWVLRVHPKKLTEPLSDYLDLTESPSFDDVSRFNLHWTLFPDVLTWYELPNGSVIVIDECQQWFPPRPVGSKVPLHCSEFETHRHKGFDIHLVTQDAKLLDSHVRRLTNRHIHFHNPFASGAVTRLLSDKVFEPSNWHERQNTTSTVVKRDKTFYGLYWSADIHTHKMYIPKKLIILIIAFISIIFVLIFYFNTRFKSDVSTPSDVSSVLLPAASNASSSISNDELKPSSSFVHDGFTHLPLDAFADTEHPLSNYCDKVILTAHETKITQHGVSRSYYLQCEQYESGSDKKTNVLADAHLLNDQYLARLGYKLTAESGLVTLTYKNLKFFTSTF